MQRAAFRCPLSLLGHKGGTIPFLSRRAGLLHVPDGIERSGRGNQLSLIRLASTAPLRMEVPRIGRTAMFHCHVFVLGSCLPVSQWLFREDGSTTCERTLGHSH